MKLKMISLIKACIFFASIILGAIIVGFNFVIGLTLLLIGIIGLVLQAYNIINIISYDGTVFEKGLKDFYKDRFKNIKQSLAKFFKSNKDID